jgi:LacI family transcriptional regulator, repressor for deo operon, udp, cdd, tsx, nupC, and nupG
MMHVRRRRRVGADCAVVGFDDLALAAGLDPPLTTMRAEVERLGGEALRLLLRRIAGHPSEQVLLPRRLVRRASSAAG